MLRIIQLVSGPGLKLRSYYSVFLSGTLLRPHEEVSDKETEAHREEVVLDSNAVRRLQSLGLTCCVMLPFPGTCKSISRPHVSHGGKPRTTCDDETNVDQLVSRHRMQTCQSWYCFWGLQGSEDDRPCDQQQILSLAPGAEFTCAFVVS